MSDDLFLVLIGYSVFFGSLVVLLLWTKLAERNARRTLAELQRQVGKVDDK